MYIHMLGSEGELPIRPVCSLAIRMWHTCMHEPCIFKRNMTHIFLILLIKSKILRKTGKAPQNPHEACFMKRMPTTMGELKTPANHSRVDP